MTGRVHVSCNSKELTRHLITLVCERGTLLLENAEGVTEHFTLTACVQDKEELIQVKKEKGKEGEDERVRIVRKLTTRFVEGVVSGEGVRPSMQDGVKVQKLIESIRKS